MASNSNQYNQVVYDLIQFEDTPSAPVAPAATDFYQHHISNGIYPSIPNVSQQEPIQHIQMTQQPSFQGNLSTNKIETNSSQAIHHCFINDNGVSYQHVIIPTTDQNQILHVNNNYQRVESQNKIPICYIGFHCLFLIILSITIVIIQAMLKYFGAGIWAGLFSILTGVIGSFLSI
jgi:hypothetical protein